MSKHRTITGRVATKSVLKHLFLFRYQLNVRHLLRSNVLSKAERGERNQGYKSHWIRMQPPVFTPT
ncbi:unnamed protein product [Gulo gulo]|uniref:Uncharacterized protein n=1 Tax=Gulo gulo TaxID=48420 RepID=A0A9X9LS21_GULGU|nr:unnamed protein product [Gulo gulo]